MFPIPEPFDRILALVALLVGVVLGWTALICIGQARASEPLRGHHSLPLRGRWLMWFLGVGSLLASVWLVGLCLFIMVVLPGLFFRIRRLPSIEKAGTSWIMPAWPAWRRFAHCWFLSTVFIAILTLGILPFKYSVPSPDGKVIASSTSAGLLVQAISSHAPRHFPRPLSRFNGEVRDIETGERIRLFEKDHNGFLAVDSVTGIRWELDGTRVTFEETEGFEPFWWDNVWEVTRRPLRVIEH